MGFIRERKLKNGSTRFQAEIRLKGISKSVTAVFDRKTDAKTWIQKVEADIRCGRQQLYSEGRRHTFAEAVERYRKERLPQLSKRVILIGGRRGWDRFIYRMSVPLLFQKKSKSFYQHQLLQGEGDRKKTEELAHVHRVWSKSKNQFK